jgi:hypothetical protein
MDEDLVKCDECGKTNKISKYEIIDEYALDERKMGVEVAHVKQGFVECKCGNEITITYEGYEYPEGAPIDGWEFQSISGGTRE